MAAAGSTAIPLVTLTPTPTAGTTTSPPASTPSAAAVSTPQGQQQTGQINAAQATVTSPAGSSSAVAAMAASQPRNPILKFLLATWLGNVATALGVVLALITTVTAIRFGLSQIAFNDWSARSTTYQTCLTKYSMGLFSSECNATIAAGVPQAPLLRRYPPRFGSLRQPATEEKGHKFSKPLLGIALPFGTVTARALALAASVLAGCYRFCRHVAHVAAVQRHTREALEAALVLKSPALLGEPVEATEAKRPLSSDQALPWNDLTRHYEALDASALASISLERRALSAKIADIPQDPFRRRLNRQQALELLET